MEEAFKQISDIHFSLHSVITRKSETSDFDLKESFYRWVSGRSEHEDYRDIDWLASPVSKTDFPDDITWADIIDYSEGLVKELKAKGLGVYALSNYPDKLSDLHWPTFKFLKEMDGYVISAKVKLLKPGEEIYRCLADKYGIKLEESVFVDDTAVNVEAAEALGMKGIVFKGIDDLKNELKSCIL